MTSMKNNNYYLIYKSIVTFRLLSVGYWPFMHFGSSGSVDSETLTDGERKAPTHLHTHARTHTVHTLTQCTHLHTHLHIHSTHTHTYTVHMYLYSTCIPTHPQSHTDKHTHKLEVCGYSIFATRPVPVAQDRYPYPYPTRTQNYYPTRPVPAGIPVPVTVKPSNV